MEKQNFKTLEQKAVELFGSKAVVSVTKCRANSKYVYRMNMQGMPFELSVVGDSLSEAKEIAYTEFYKRVEDAIKNDLFTTQPKEKYEQVPLTDELYDQIFKFEGYFHEDLKAQLKEETTIKMCHLDNNNYECVIESSYKSLRARGTGVTKELAMRTALWKAREVFDQDLIRIGYDKL